MRDHQTAKRRRDGKGLRSRGERVTRMEVFVDATFAFAVTLPVISCARIAARGHRHLLASVTS